MATTRTGDRRAASSQLKAVDQSARVSAASRAKEEAGEVTVPLKGRQPSKDKDGLVVRDEDDKIVYEPVVKDFRLADEVGIMALMEWVAAAEGKKDETSKSLVAVYHVLEDTVHEDDWDEFRQFGRESKLQAKDYGEFINAALEAVAGRPTEESTGS